MSNDHSIIEMLREQLRAAEVEVFILRKELEKLQAEANEQEEVEE